MLKVFLMRHIGLKDTSSDEAPFLKLRFSFAEQMNVLHSKKFKKASEPNLK